MMTAIKIFVVAALVVVMIIIVDWFNFFADKLTKKK